MKTTAILLTLFAAGWPEGWIQVVTAPVSATISAADITPGVFGSATDAVTRTVRGGN